MAHYHSNFQYVYLPEIRPQSNHLKYMTFLITPSSAGGQLWGWHKRRCCNSFRHYWLSRNGNASNILASQRKKAKKQEARNTTRLREGKELQSLYMKCECLTRQTYLNQFSFQLKWIPSARDRYKVYFQLHSLSTTLFLNQEYHMERIFSFNTVDSQSMSIRSPKENPLNLSLGKKSKLD